MHTRIIAAALLLCLLVLSCGCKQQPAPSPTEPTVSDETTAPTVPASPKPTEPPIVGKPIPSQKWFMDGLECLVTIGEQAPKTVENPLASDLYYYLVDVRSNAEKKMPETISNVESIQFSFQVNGKQTYTFWVYSDDYGATPISEDSGAYQYYAFPRGCYADLLATVDTQ